MTALAMQLGIGLENENELKALNQLRVCKSWSIMYQVTNRLQKRVSEAQEELTQIAALVPSSSDRDFVRQEMALSAEGALREYWSVAAQQKQTLQGTMTIETLRLLAKALLSPMDTSASDSTALTSTANLVDTTLRSESDPRADADASISSRSVSTFPGKNQEDFKSFLGIDEQTQQGRELWEKLIVGKSLS